MSTVRIEPIKPHIGGTVHVAKSHLLDDHTVAAVREALELRGVLVFPRIGVTDAEQLALTDKLGQRVNYNRKAPGSGAGGAEDVYTVTLDKKINFQPEYVLGTFFWHIDGVTINPSTRLDAQLGSQVAGDWLACRQRRRSAASPRPVATGATAGMGCAACLHLPS